MACMPFAVAPAAALLLLFSRLACGPYRDTMRHCMHACRMQCCRVAVAPWGQAPVASKGCSDACTQTTRTTQLCHTLSSSSSSLILVDCGRLLVL